MGEFLQVKHIFFGYTSTLVLEDISFAVARGEFLGIIGPNGAGKSTLLKTLNRILIPWRGEILFAGRNLQTLGVRKIAQKMSMVGQDIRISFSLTVLDLVLMGRFPHTPRFKKEAKQDLEIARDSLELTQTLALAERHFDQLSAGERQRVILAKALAQEPQLLLLDEPTAHLDIGHQIKVFDLLRNLNLRRKLTIIAVLHDLNLAAEYCQKLILLDKGRLVSWGSCREVLQYTTIEKTYETIVLVKENPLSQKPYVIPVPGKYAHLNKDSHKLDD